jgi:hypothetical protein
MPSRRERKLAGGGGRFVVIAAEDETPGREDPTPGLGRHGKAGDQFPDTTQRQHGPGPRDEVKCSSFRAEPLPGAVSQLPPQGTTRPFATARRDERRTVQAAAAAPSRLEQVAGNRRPTASSRRYGRREAVRPGRRSASEANSAKC